MTGVSEIGQFRIINKVYLLTTSVFSAKHLNLARFFLQNAFIMDSPLNFKEKFKTLINKTKVGNDVSTPDSTLADYEDFVKNSGFARATRTSAISINRGRIQGPLSEEDEDELLKCLEDQYYNEDFDPIPHELAKFPENFDQAAVDVQRKRLLRQLKVVTKRAYAQILEKRPEYNQEFVKVETIKQELSSTLKAVQQGREGLLQARQRFTASSLGILAAYRRRQRAQTLLDNLNVITTLQRTDDRLHQCLDEGDYSGAIRLLFDAQEAAKEHSHFKAIQQLSIKLQDTLELAEEQLDVALSKVCIDYRQQTYQRLQDAYKLLDKTLTSMDQLQMHSASAVHNTAWNVVYNHVVLCNADPTEMAKKLYGDLCGQLPRSSLLPCLIDLCRSLSGIMKSYQQIYQFHLAQETQENEFVLKKLSNGFQRIWQDVQTKVKVLLTANPVKGINIEDFLKIIDATHLLIEIGKKFCGSDSESLKHSLKEQCLAYFNSYHQERLEELKMHLDNEGWALCPVKSTFKIQQLVEFRYVAKQAKSPRKSNLDYFHVFHDFLEESVLEEDFLLDELSDDEENEILHGNSIEDETDVKGVDENMPILTNTSLMLLRLFGKYLHLLQILNPISQEVFKGLTALFDFYFLTVFRLFTKDLNDLNSAVISPQLQTVIDRTKEMFGVDSPDHQHQRNQSLPNGVLESQLEIMDAEKLHGLEQKIVATESVLYVAQQFHELKQYFPVIEFVQDYFENTLGCIENLRDPIFMTSCDKAINSDVILPLMHKVAWDIREVRSQHSQYVDILLRVRN